MKSTDFDARLVLIDADFNEEKLKVYCEASNRARLSYLLLYTGGKDVDLDPIIEFAQTNGFKKLFVLNAEGEED